MQTLATERAEETSERSRCDADTVILYRNIRTTRKRLHHTGRSTDDGVMFDLDLRVRGFEARLAGESLPKSCVANANRCTHPTSWTCQTAPRARGSYESAACVDSDALQGQHLPNVPERTFALWSAKTTVTHIEGS